jgi:hypothetical protein
MISNSEMSVFLTRYAENPNVEWAAKQAGISRASVYRFRRTDAKFCRDMDRSKALWTNALVEKAHGKLNELVDQGKWPAVRYVLEKNPVQYPNPMDSRAFTQVAKKFPELAPDEAALDAPLINELTGVPTYRTRDQALAEETPKYHDRAMAAEISEKEEFEERLSVQEQAETPLVLPQASAHTKSIIPIAFRQQDA